MIGDMFGDAGVWIVFLCCLIVGVWLMKQWTTMILLWVMCFGGFMWSTVTLHTLEVRRDTLGERVGWSGFTHKIE